MIPIYIATAICSGTGREGHVETTDGKLDLDLSAPRELGGSGAGTNPEQLVALGYAACFSSALALTARRRNVDLTSLEVTCQVSLLQAEGDEHYSLAFDIAATLAQVPFETASSLVAEAHTVCAYSKAFTQGAPALARASAV